MRQALFWTIFGVLLWADPSRSLSQPRIPLGMPFEFDIKAGGTYSSETDSIPKYHTLPTTTRYSHPDTVTEKITVDTSIVGSQFFYSGDTIIWTDTIHEGTNCDRLKEDRFVFDTTHSILLYLYIRDYRICENGSDWLLTCTNLAYQSDTIVAGWPFDSEDVGSLSSDDGTITEYPSVTIMQTNSYFGSVLAITGHVVMKAAVASHQSPQHTSIRISSNPAECSLDPSSYPRILEVYSPLGAKIGSFNIFPDQNSISLPRLGAGLYFLRLDGVVAKVYLPSE